MENFLDLLGRKADRAADPVIARLDFLGNPSDGSRGQAHDGRNLADGHESVRHRHAEQFGRGCVGILLGNTYVVHFVHKASKNRGQVRGHIVCVSAGPELHRHENASDART